MAFAIVYGLGVLLCIICAAIIITRMERNLKGKNLWVDLGAQPGLLVVLGGFFAFPILNAAIGAGILVFLLQNKPDWKD